MPACVAGAGSCEQWSGRASQGIVAARIEGATARRTKPAGEMRTRPTICGDVQARAMAPPSECPTTTAGPAIAFSSASVSHCRYQAIRFRRGRWSTLRPGCPGTSRMSVGHRRVSFSAKGSDTAAFMLVPGTSTIVDVVSVGSGPAARTLVAPAAVLTSHRRCSIFQPSMRFLHQPWIRRCASALL